MRRKTLVQTGGGIVLVLVLMGVTAYLTYQDEKKRLEPILEEQRRVIAEQKQDMQAEMDAVSQREDLSFEEKVELIQSIHRKYSDKNIENLERTMQQIVDDQDSDF